MEAKLYIPTSTFNFNNILSSESISPKAFYTRRGFGYSRWMAIPENSYENAILLYDKPFMFSRPKSEIEDHPMLIEASNVKELQSVSDGIFYCDHTIYLSPWHTRFIFFTEEDKKVALSLSESSAETKMVALYQRKLVVEQCPSCDYAPRPIAFTEPALNEQAIRYDQNINKMKGLLYGYYIGALLSTTPDNVRKYNILQELKNITSAILSSDGHKYTPTQEQRVRNLLGNWCVTDPAVIYLSKYLSDGAKETQKINEILDGLSKYGVIFPDSIGADSFIYDLVGYTDSENRALKWLNKESETLDHGALDDKILHPDEKEIVVSNGQTRNIAENRLSQAKEQDLAKAWVNETLASEKYNEKISVFKDTLADDVTYKAKDIYDDQWSNSAARIALNEMRKYIKGIGNNFRWDDLLISSMAAVIAKGSEWEQLLSFMKSKNICDYRLAFAFYGELNGFANLTRDFTDLLLTKESNYVASVYKEFSKQLLGVDVTSNGTLSSENRSDKAPTDSNEEWKQGAESFIKREIRKPNQEKAKALEILWMPTTTTPNMFIDLLKKISGWTKGSNFNKLKDFFSQLKNSSNQLFPISDKNNSTIFDNQSGNENSVAKPGLPSQYSMFEDKSWWFETANIIKDDKAREQYLEDVRWFIENHNEYYENKKGHVKGYYYGKPKENEQLLKRFRLYLQNKKKLNPKWPEGEKIYSKVPIDYIIQHLTSRYVNR